MAGRWLAFGVAALVAVMGVVSGRAEDQRPPVDYARVNPEELGVKPVPPKKDPATGFVVGGKNPSSLVAGLTEIAGQPIRELEVAMRPGQLSSAGFLGKKERLLDVLAEDNRFVVDELGLTHQQLARPLLVLGAVAERDAVQGPREVTYEGRRFRVRATVFKATVSSPFDDGTKTHCEVTAENQANGNKLTYSLLVPQMIERYGFYEGKGTRFRVEPRLIVQVFNFLPATKRP